MVPRGGTAAAGSVQGIGVDTIISIAAKAGVSATVRAGSIGSSIVAATVTVAAGELVRDIIVIITAAGV